MTPRLVFHRDAMDADGTPCATSADALDLLTRYGGGSYVDVFLDGRDEAIGFVYPAAERGPWRYDADNGTGRADTLDDAIARLVRAS